MGSGTAETSEARAAPCNVTTLGLRLSLSIGGPDTSLIACEERPGSAERYTTQLARVSAAPHSRRVGRQRGGKGEAREADADRWQRD